ncbi:cellulose synthase/poly-beta-1,6-N-acetylglucosamine synthase-like glycosyltransferase [Wenyingzhuangia heitensis]|uniref:Cellulose synthase/poly-beta-1,6-N-acetylglucosamine synthase-like glycosyltransferase n=1 Tax=Wenyingzhuangia heitensis TaxID=1487859 RepID=A0ABX0UA66_9FLAO|nr:glycosyltransferase [Wenyingzhuangia heitensis]NIJ44710.1 cellulose synthase/poly-beta-1,6-N-acetylglucosamine synthase-like glycosyltransferase [Wenyingzhuangia heitensis]
MYSFIIPLYNRPDEIDELLYSLTKQNFSKPFEVVVVEDGSENNATKVVSSYNDRLNIQYFLTENQGAGMARNYGMSHAEGDYFIVLDSDVLVPANYLKQVHKALKENYTDAFGGPDAAHSSFTPLQKAINFSMTSVLTTGGIRGKKKAVGKFQPRSFNLGISKKAFETTRGFSAMKIGEDIDLSFRLWNNGFETQLIEKAFVYHKRRNTIDSFFTQTFKFGQARPVLNKKYPGTAKLTYWFPSLFIVGFLLASVLFVMGKWELITFYYLYFMILFMTSLVVNKNVTVAFLSIITTLVQMGGYGFGFLKSMFFKK